MSKQRSVWEGLEKGGRSRALQHSSSGDGTVLRVQVISLYKKSIPIDAC